MTTLTGTRYPKRATPLLSGHSGSLAVTTLDTGYEPKICVDVCGEHTPIHFPFRDNIFNQEDDLTNLVANPEDFDHSPQQTEDSRNHYSAATIVPALLNLVSFSSTGKLVRSNDPVANFEDEMSKKKRERDLDSVITMVDRQHLQEFLEWKGESAVRGEIAAQERLSQAEADMEIRRWEQKKSEVAFYQFSSKTRISQITATSGESMG